VYFQLPAYDFSLTSKHVAQNQTDRNLVFVDGWYFPLLLLHVTTVTLIKTSIDYTLFLTCVNPAHGYEPDARAEYVSTITSATFKQYADKHNTAPQLTFQNRRAVKLLHSVISSLERNDIF